MSMVRTARGNLIDFDQLASKANNTKPASAIRKAKKPIGGAPVARIKGFTPAPAPKESKGASTEEPKANEKTLAEHTKVAAKTKPAKAKKESPPKKKPSLPEEDEVLGKIPS